MRGTVIQCIRQASGELGLPLPVEVVASNEVQAQQMLALLNAAGNELVRMYEWQFLRRTATLNLIADKPNYPVASDFSKLINQTLWEESNVYSVIGPVSPRAWAYLTNSLTLAPNFCFIIKNNEFQFSPAPGQNGLPSSTITYEYIGDGWIKTYNDPLVYSSLATNDLDEIELDFWLLVKLLKLKTWEAKGLDTTALRDDFMRSFSDISGQDHGAAVLTLSRRANILPAPIAPDTGYGL